ncbi:Glycosyltransferase involved in cell wall bisynthesis [Filimonas lacunae]|uniref:Glycosyltransferase involved in cell wall bisynthesis n=1 Tax=Filimonas lacunae TaxID=477680 RepID=A0A173MGY4_9BACT|nr:glycosyltransferase family 4 protein [Filimonas lacunae]BAV06884.1 glycosyltransferase family 4 protein [Filimonas lacunae]SIS98389.1 Glycosyltransferase involved in cell wall bisynthesis [Filimonas lacunae]
MQLKRIVAVHLLNDFSGSPLVLQQILEVASEHSQVHVFTATPSGTGVLSNIPGVQYHSVYYRWHARKWLTLLYFMWAQVTLFGRLLCFLRASDTVYINTLLPFGAALAAVCRRCRIIYHVHEVSIQPRLLKQLLVTVARITADMLVFVSEYVKQQFRFPEHKTTVIYNALPERFTSQAMQMQQGKAKEPFTVVMLCSLKKYKGVYQFITVAQQMPHIHFMLVLNAQAAEVQAFRQATAAPANCEIYPVQANPLPFYSRAHLVVNFSLPDTWIETFGMTILEGMYCGLPAIVPPVGGVTELVQNGEQGIYADARDCYSLTRYIALLATSDSLYYTLASAARERAQHFSQQRFSSAIRQLLGHSEGVAC